jgi:hypothetical protein
MRAAPLLVVLLVAAGCGSQTTTLTRSETETVTRTETATETVEAAVGLPAPVAATHAELLAAAKTGDYEALRPLVPTDQFSYTFGLPSEGGPIAYWQQVEEDSGERPIDVLARILELPYTLYRGTYVWPFAYDKQPEDLTPHERKLLGDLADDFGAGSGYLGWRAGIEPDGTWSFFIAGD